MKVRKQSESFLQILLTFFSSDYLELKQSSDRIHYVICIGQIPHLSWELNKNYYYAFVSIMS